MIKPQEMLTKLGLSTSEQIVYLTMQNGVRNVKNMAKTTRQKIPTIYYALHKLEERGLISKTGKAFDERYALAPTDHLRMLIEERKRETETLSKEVDEWIKTSVETKPQQETPAVSFYEGQEAVKNVIMEALYCRDKKILTIAPQKNFFHQVGPEFVAQYVGQRVQRQIKTRNLWEQETDQKTFQRYYVGLSDVRILPPVMHGKFDSTISIYDDKVLSISSQKNSYALLMTSREYHDTMEAIFDGLWVSSTQHHDGRTS